MTNTLKDYIAHAILMCEHHRLEGRDPEVHVFPVDDAFEHVTEGYECWCNPEVTEDGVVVHNSADGRDDYEDGKRKVH